MNKIHLIAVLALSLLGPAVHADPALDHAKEVLGKSILFDGHNDLPWAIRGNAAAPGDVAPMTSASTRPRRGRDRHPAPARGPGRRAVLVRLHAARGGGPFRAHPARADRHRAADDRALPRHLHAREHRRRHPRGEGRRQDRRHAGRGGRPRDRGFARGAARLLRPRRALHDADPQQAHELGRLGGRRFARRTADSPTSASRSCTR